MERWLQAGTEFAGRYLTEGVIGAGDRKVVYRAHDRVVNRTVALAILREGSQEHESVEREAQVMGLLSDSPHIVTVYDTGVCDGTGYIVSQHMAGGDLRSHCERIRARGDQLPMADVLRFGDEICQALAFVHEHRLIHRDVSPSNVWLDSEGRACLGDFDSAVSLDEQQPLDPASLVTTEGYMAPELAIGSYVDERSDLYSLGATLYELATGARPFSGDEDALTRPGELRSDLPSALDELVCRLLATSPSDRPDSVAAVRDSLAEIGITADLGSLLASGESDRLEFKSSLRYPHGAREQSAGDDRREVVRALQAGLEKAVAKAIAAFLNTDGGILLIGVNDEGRLLGIEHDFETLGSRKNLDGWSLAFQQTIANYLGRDASSCIALSFTRADDATVAVVRCEKRAKPTWLRDASGEALHIRFGTSSEALSPSQAATYIAERWS
jgi:eukaryotic-like serine/threonine-protein kinase